MESVNILLDRFAKTCYAKKDKEIAARLHVRPSSVSNWRHGTSKPEPESIEKMADAIGEPFGKWLAAIEAERARTAEAKRVWLRLAQTLGATAAITAIALHPHGGEWAFILPNVSNDDSGKVREIQRKRISHELHGIAAAA